MARDGRLTIREALNVALQAPIRNWWSRTCWQHDRPREVDDLPIEPD